jgi:hypothetical protein
MKILHACNIDFYNRYKINLNYIKYIKKDLVPQLSDDSADMPKHVVVKDYTFEFVICALSGFDT